MKTKEVIKKLEELGYICELKGDKIKILEVFKQVDFFPPIHIAVIALEERYLNNTNFTAFASITESERGELYEIFDKFVKSSLPDRQEEKKFYLRHKYFKSAIGSYKYFCIYTGTGNPFLRYYEITNTYKFEFTLKEIEEIKEKYNTDLSDFELMED